MSGVVSVLTMDIMAHALYGATFCSRTGLAGGKSGFSGRRWFLDSSVWLSMLFGMLPDILSMWIPFTVHFVSGAAGNFFVSYGGGWLVVYRMVHSLVVALGFSLLVGLVWRRGFLPSLAWVVHILCDAVSHGAGKFQTRIFYPFSTWGIVGIPFWRSPGFVAGYWLALVVIWAGLRYGYRRDYTRQ